jgi:CrcB protein
MNFTLLTVIGLGGFFGAISRFLIAGFVQKQTGSLFPFGTLTVNILGSFIIGFAFIYFENTIAPEYKALVMTGFLGALTTFSTFSLESVSMLQDGDYLHCGLNILLNVVLCIVATTIAINIAKKLFI